MVVRTVCAHGPWLNNGKLLSEYDCEIWECEIPESKDQEFETIQSKFGRATLGTTVLVSACAARADRGLSTLKAHRQIIKLGYPGIGQSYAAQILQNFGPRFRWQELKYKQPLKGIDQSYRSEWLFLVPAKRPAF